MSPGEAGHLQLPPPGDEVPRGEAEPEHRGEAAEAAGRQLEADPAPRPPAAGRQQPAHTAHCEICTKTK